MHSVLAASRPRCSGHSTVPLYYVIDLDRNYITAEVNDLDDLEKWGRDLGVLRPWEGVAE